MLELDGQNLSLVQVAAVARGAEQVRCLRRPATASSNRAKSLSRS